MPSFCALIQQRLVFDQGSPHKRFVGLSCSSSRLLEIIGVTVTDESHSEPSFESDDEISEEEINAFRDMVNRERENPAISCPISYVGSACEEEVRDAVFLMKVAAWRLREKQPWLNFDALESIAFRSDYDVALSELGARIGRDLSPTNDATGSGVAMVVPVGDRSVVVFSAGILHAVMPSALEDYRDVAFDTFLHELCHVFDNARKHSLLGHEIGVRVLPGLDAHFRAAADSAWSEYFANRYSNSHHSSVDMHPKLLAEVIPSVAEAVLQEIVILRSGGDFDEVLSECKRKVRYLFMCFGYAAGRLAANNQRLEEVAPESVAQLEGAGLWAVWCQVVQELSVLDDRRDAWSSFDDFRPLMSLVGQTFTQLGLQFSLRGDAVHVDIDF